MRAENWEGGYLGLFMKGISNRYIWEREKERDEIVRFYNKVLLGYQQ